MKMPWDLIRILITETYGGKIDNEEDFQQLSTIVNKNMTPAAFDDGHRLVDGVPAKDGRVVRTGDGGLAVPEGTSMADFMKWVDMLPEREPPTYLGLPANAEKLLLVGHGQETMANVGRITQMLEEGEHLAAEVDDAV